jgi:hypothetical protein
MKQPHLSPLLHHDCNYGDNHPNESTKCQPGGGANVANDDSR